MAKRKASIDPVRARLVEFIDDTLERIRADIQFVNDVTDVLNALDGDEEKIEKIDGNVVIGAFRKESK